MSSAAENPALARLLETEQCAEALTLLGSELPGSDMTSLLLAALAQRANSLSSSDVLSQYQRDRFVAPAAVDPITLGRLGLQGLEALAKDFVPVETSPVAPLGSHSVFAGVNQNNVVSTVRMTEVAADPTNQLALEAAVRRRTLLDNDPRSAESVRLCAVDRVLRAQRFDGPRSFSHFSLLGAIVSGRDVGNRLFETEALVSVLTNLSAFVGNASGRPIKVALSDFDGSYGGVLAEVSDRITTDQVTCRRDPDRHAGYGYYPNACFKLAVDMGTETVEVGDGGAVDWMAALLQSRKERLVIAGVSLERLALL